ncbi:hypothetical protein QBC35DRAFT_484786 [Podospora australis]|uniref:Translation initiation factor IF-2, mitochondrial n=1 Tax=Podospora australis TaxID=1536484 RepID=A0AAN6X1D5_9PEZI|nr:hypothetical protein QBC35DRAFT_484786 [Podospora australis]
MRGGLWQKQKRPSACLLCTYSYRQRLRPVALPRTSSNLSKTGHADPIKLTAATRPSIARQEPISHDVRHIRLWGSSGWGAGLASAIKEETTDDNDDGLLPHERAAKEAAQKAAQEKAAREKAAQEKAAQEKAAREKAAQERIAELAGRKPAVQGRYAARPLSSQGAPGATGVSKGGLPTGFSKSTPPTSGVPRTSSGGQNGLPAGFTRPAPPRPPPPPSGGGPSKIDGSPAMLSAAYGRALPQQGKVFTAENAPVIRRLLDMGKIKENTVSQHLPTASRGASLPVRSPPSNPPVAESPKPPAPQTVLGTDPPVVSKPAPSLANSPTTVNTESVSGMSPPVTTRPPESTPPQPATPQPASSWGTSSWGTSSWAPLGGTTSTVTGSLVQENEDDDGLLPHERAAREAAKAAKEAKEAAAAKLVAPNSNPAAKPTPAAVNADADLPPHERPARHTAKAAREAEAAKSAAAESTPAVKPRPAAVEAAKPTPATVEADKSTPAAVEATKPVPEAVEAPKVVASTWGPTIEPAPAAVEAATSIPAAVEAPKVVASSWGPAIKLTPAAVEADDDLLPHERAAREAANATRQAASAALEAAKSKSAPAANPPAGAVEVEKDVLSRNTQATRQTGWATTKTTTAIPSADASDDLLPHELAARRASSPSWQAQDRKTTDASGNSSSQPSLFRRVGVPPSKVWTPTSRPSNRSSDQQWDTLAGVTPSEPSNQEWGQLTRRNKPDLARAFDFSQTTKSPSPMRQPTADPWDKLTETAAKPEEGISSATDEATWNWVGDHLKSKDTVSEDRSGWKRPPSEKAPEHPGITIEPGAETGPSRWDNRNDRAQAEEYERRKKPKNTRRSNQLAEDDDYDDEAAEERRRRKAERKAEKERQRLAALDVPTPILLPEFISVANLATALGEKINKFVRQLEELGFEEVTKESILTGETAALIAQEYGFEPTVEAGEELDLKPRPPPEDPSVLPLRPPVVTIMGHVDHGKTTLLDYLRKSSIVSQEHGGITQHIGAFSVKMSTGKMITFLDTPGHAAFLSMRQRGANVTDMVVLVVAADDSVKPQTLEALKHARAAKVPIIVAINKIDKPEANIDRVKNDLSSHGVEIEDYGGEVQVVPVSGKTGEGMDDLEENILLLAELLDIRSEVDGMAEGWVLESSIKPIGRVATVLVKRGTLRPGDFIVAGRVQTKIRLLRNEAGQEIDEAPPGTAVEILGWKEPPAAGDMVLQAPDEGRAKDAVAYRQEQLEREEAIAQQAEMDKTRREKEAAEAAAEAAKKAEADGEDAADVPTTEGDPASHTKMINFTVKGDVHGSVEAVTASVLEQGNDEVRPRVLQFSTGQINPSDVEHASISGSTIINFNSPIPGNIKRMADDLKVAIIDHNVIYHLVEEVRDKLSEFLAPVTSWKVVGEAELLQVFPINIKGRKYKNIAGCRVRNGTLQKNSRCRVIRGGEVVHEGNIDSLKHGKKEVSEIKKGSECGLSFPNWDDFKEGDQIQMVEEVIEKRKL